MDFLKEIVASKMLFSTPGVDNTSQCPLEVDRPKPPNESFCHSSDI